MYISETPAAWHRRTTQKAKTNAQECMRRRMCANKNDATETYKIVSQSITCLILVQSNCIANDVFGGLGDTGPPGPKANSKAGAD